MFKYTFTFERETELKDCIPCPLWDAHGYCAGLETKYRTTSEQFRHCPLKKPQEITIDNKKVDYASPCRSCQHADFSPKQYPCNDCINGDGNLDWFAPVIDNTPFVSFSNSERGEMKPLTDYIRCRKCGEMHKVCNGATKNPDGTLTESTALQFIKCNDGTLLLVGINRKRIERWD